MPIVGVIGGISLEIGLVTFVVHNVIQPVIFVDTYGLGIGTGCDVARWDSVRLGWTNYPTGCTGAIDTETRY